MSLELLVGGELEVIHLVWVLMTGDIPRSILRGEGVVGLDNPRIFIEKIFFAPHFYGKILKKIYFCYRLFANSHHFKAYV